MKRGQLSVKKTDDMPWEKKRPVFLHREEEGIQTSFL